MSRSSEYGMKNTPADQNVKLDSSIENFTQGRTEIQGTINYLVQGLLLRSTAIPYTWLEIIHVINYSTEQTIVNATIITLKVITINKIAIANGAFGGLHFYM
jgi:hypothetical protein